MKRGMSARPLKSIDAAYNSTFYLYIFDVVDC